MADKQKKSKLRARLPRGLADRGPADIAATRRMIETIQRVYELYGFDPVETPAIEFTDALGKFLPDQDRPNEGVFSFQDDDEQWMSLRYDLTAPLARYVAENFDALPKPYRSYRAGWVFRNEKPGPGRFRQFMQFDADTVGSSSPAADAEICMMAADAMEALGIPRGSYVVKVNNRKVLDGVLEAIGLGGDENAGRRLTVLRAIDKMDKFPVDEIRKLLGPGRWDGGEEGKGDFTKGAGLSEQSIDSLLAFTNPKANRYYSMPVADHGQLLDDDHWQDVSVSPVLGQIFKSGKVYYDNAGLLGHWADLLDKTSVGREAIAELQHINAIVRSVGYGSNRIRIDPSVVRGLEYYTGPVFEVELLLDTKDEKGRPVRFGSVGGGGRYDGLVSRFRGEPVPATGFSIGVSRLRAALDIVEKGKAAQSAPPGPVVVTVFDKDRLADYQRMVKVLRDAGIRAELYLGNPKNMGAQFKYADKRNSPCVVIQGGDEKDHSSGTPHVLIKDLIIGAEIANLSAEREDYLAKQALAQVLIPQDQLVAEVQKVIARHAAKS